MKKIKFFAIPLSALFVLSAGLLAACGKATWHDADIWLTKNAAVPTESVSLPVDDGDRTNANNKSEVSVHDPSIFRDPADGKYYAFGTHFAVASSANLIEWTQEATDEDYSVLYGSEGYTYGDVTWPAALQSTVDAVEPVSSGSSAVTTTWAPDVEYINGKYYMYYSLTKGFGYSKSIIARVEADSVLGPYSNNTILVSSMDNDGSGPNCIDPELFYDKDGGLWMVYGSFFGGIYVLELDPSTGLLKNSDDGYGTLVWKTGYSEGVEGPHIFYNATTGYYYLIVSEGDLNTVYNMRVARSTSPNGPYVDITGEDVSTSAGTGNKLAGNYKFESTSGNGYAALGHHSVIKDSAGRYLLVCHVRRMSESTVFGAHTLNVFQLYFNEDGWPVMSPNAYVGEKAGLVTASQVAQEYEVILHSVATVQTMVTSEDYTLTSEGKVTLDSVEVGSWSLSQDYYIDITIDGVTYSGVVAPGWDMYSGKSSQKGVLSITAVSDSGRSLWAIAK